MKKSQESLVPDRPVGKNGKRTATRTIDFTDIPELTEQQLAVMKRVGRPSLGTSPRKAVSIRLDPNVLHGIKKTAAQKGIPYQSLINDILAKAVN